MSRKQACSRFSVGKRKGRPMDDCFSGCPSSNYTTATLSYDCRSYLFYLSKYYELLDTIFLVLKKVMKKNTLLPLTFEKKPLDFLHCYHHAIVPFSAWLGFQGWYMPIMWFDHSYVCPALTRHSLRTGCLFNSAVHVVMYFYYMMATLGKTVWWKVNFMLFNHE